MPFKDPEQEKAYKKRKYEENRETMLAQMKVYRENNRDAVNAKSKEWHDSHKEHMHQWRKDNRDKLRESARAWRLANPEKMKEIKRKWREKNRDKVNAQKRASAKKHAATIRARNFNYQRANPDKCKVWRKRCYDKNPVPAIECARKRAGIINDKNARLSRGLTKRLLVAQNFKCVLCPADLRLVKYHRDHIVALSKGGAHCDSNIQILCATCNLRKGAK